MRLREMLKPLKSEAQNTHKEKRLKGEDKMYNMESRTPKMRTIDQAIADIKERDANTAITKNAIERLAYEGAIPVVRIGRKNLSVPSASFLRYADKGHFLFFAKRR